MSLKVLFLLLVIILLSIFTYFAFVRDVGYDTIMDNIYKPSNNAMLISKKIAEKCKGDDICVITGVRSYAENISVREDNFFQNNLNWDNDFEYTFANGNDCEGIAVFSATLLKNLNITNVYIFQSTRISDNQRHEVIGVVRNNTMFLLNNLDSLEIVKARKLW